MLHCRVPEHCRLQYSRGAGSAARRRAAIARSTRHSEQPMSLEAIRSAAEAAGQSHLIAHLEALSGEEQQELLRELKDVDLPYVKRIFDASASGATPGDVAPCDGVQQMQDVTDEQRCRWRARGYRLLAEGRAGVVLLAGGQGTRLGSTAPKGCFDIGLPSGKSLFQLQAERLAKLQSLARRHHPVASEPKVLHWYIMTSPFTHDETVAHFEDHAHFGLAPDQVHFFRQGSLPCFTGGGEVILETRTKVARAPDGNGGVYLALQASGCLDHMAAAGVECVDCYCVDNALARLADPLFLGCCHEQGADVGARVVAKAHPGEKVGVFATRPAAGTGDAANSSSGSSSSSSSSSRRLCVVEYSELDPAVASAADPAAPPTSRRLLYNWANVCMHYFSVAWLRAVADTLRSGGSPSSSSSLAAAAAAAGSSSSSGGGAIVPSYHVAQKTIPSKDGPVAGGVKLELFIFDAFPLAARTALLEVDRATEFAPVKNAPGAAADSPDTARGAALKLGASWVVAAGGRLEGEAAGQGVEVSPLVSYGGEGLEWCDGAVFTTSGDARLQKASVM